MKKTLIVRLLTGGIVAGALIGQYSLGQAPGVTMLAAHAVNFTDQPSRLTVEQDVLQIAPGSCTGFHEHGGPGVETVISGTVTVMTRGETASKSFAARQAYTYPAGAVHNFCNRGKVPAVFTAAFLLPEGAPVVTPR